ncbi:hypothetical protein B5X24_HaOG203150 [Helicoverpa armigera]|uniref:C2H2-type domain-containing protein n=1 Tax=Helicoverpa armigera TaxID=29058 RepID=A0A2W1B622_HELAM|nr:hypothetical protein B5X24_HaOG203150 [Helicoverpa armigera]
MEHDTETASEVTRLNQQLEDIKHQEVLPKTSDISSHDIYHYSITSLLLGGLAVLAIYFLWKRCRKITTATEKTVKPKGDHNVAVGEEIELQEVRHPRSAAPVHSGQGPQKKICINNDSKASPKPEKEVPSKKPFDLAKRREARKRIQVNDAKAKRINIHCEVCKQRYPMLVANDGNKSFICSRCKKNGELKGAVCRKCNIVMPNSMMKDHLDLHAKADMRGKFRTQQPKKTHLTLVNSVTKQKSQRYQCTRCPKKYALARNLALHVRNSHGDSVDDMCSGCGEDLSQTEQSQHPLHQCSERVPVKANVRAANPLKSS